MRSYLYDSYDVDTISRFPIQCGLRHFYYLLSPLVVVQAISRFPIQCGLRPTHSSRAFTWALIVYQSLSNSVRITTSSAAPIVISSSSAISRFPIQCGLRLNFKVLYLVNSSKSISRFPIQCGLRPF